MSDDDEELDEPGAPRWAADEPTAMWSDTDLLDSGYQQLAEHRVAQPRAETGPATGREVGGALAEGVQVSRELTGAHPTQPRPAPAKASSGLLSWVLTFGLAIGLGVGVYLLVRLLR